MGKHGQCGMAPRGCFVKKTIKKTEAQDKFKRMFRLAKRVRSKTPADQVTYAWKETEISYLLGAFLPVISEMSVTPSGLRLRPSSALAANDHKPRACAALTQALPILCSPPPSPFSPSSSRKHLLMFQIICEYIDKEETEDHLDDGEQGVLKATALRLSVSLTSHKPCQIAFATSGVGRLPLTPSVDRRRRSISLAVLLTALGLSAFPSQSVTSETLALAIEGDATIRRKALYSRHSIINFLYRNNVINNYHQLPAHADHGP